jgi:Ser/Thr protein kinase RdoA (MazF antagonist)
VTTADVDLVDRTFSRTGRLSSVVEKIYSADHGTLRFFHDGANRTYRFQRNGCEYYLRESNGRWSKGDVCAETEIIAALRCTSYAPRLEPVRSISDNVSALSRYVFAFEGRFYWSTQSLPGNGFDSSIPQTYSVGGLLARFHADAESLESIAFRDCAVSASSISKLSIRKYMADLSDERIFAQLREYDLVSLIEDAVALGNDRLLRVAADLPQCVTHNDVTPLNLLFIRGRVAGLLDFEFVGRRERIWDIAWAIATMCWRERSQSLDWAMVNALLAGYEKTTVLRVTKLEHNILPLVILLAIAEAICWTVETYSRYSELRVRYLDQNIRMLRWVASEVVRLPCIVR